LTKAIDNHGKIGTYLIKLFFKMHFVT